MNKATIVSALFNIEREDMDGRPWEEYLKWFDIFLKLKTPMVLFITEDLVEFVTERRGSIPTAIMPQRTEDIPYFYLHDQIQEILDSEEYKEKISDPDRIECNHAMYSVIQYSKFPWMKKAAEINPHKSDVFFWLDAGASRFFGDFDLNKEFPGKPAYESLEEMGESFLIQMNCDYYPDLFQKKELSPSYLFDNRSYVLGSLFGGHKNSVAKVCDMVEDILLNRMIKKGNVNNEQIALGYLVKKHPDEFSVYSRTNGEHMDIFNVLASE